MTKNILILGSKGFIGSGLRLLLNEYNILEYSRCTNEIDKVESFDLIINCLGCNRGQNEEEFYDGNVTILEHIRPMLAKKRALAFVNLSSIHAGKESLYGKTKGIGEKKCAEIASDTGGAFYNLRLPGVFGPGAKPNYNSVVATWCVQSINGQSLEVDDEEKELELLHIYEVYQLIRNIINNKPAEINPHKITLGKLSQIIYSFPEYSKNIRTFEPRGKLEKLLFSTFISYLKPSDTIYRADPKIDGRGSFTEIIKFQNAGQISVSVTPPDSGVRGGHFHSGKIEKFYVAAGRAKVRNLNLLNGQEEEFILDSKTPETFITIPYWHHTIENISSVPLVLILWSNENFDPLSPDTVNLNLNDA